MEVGLTKSHGRSQRDRSIAAPVEGDFGGDFVRRNRSQLRHVDVRLRWSVTQCTKGELVR
jgi:hypothetical protein